MSKFWERFAASEEESSSSEEEEVVSLSDDSNAESTPAPTDDEIRELFELKEETESGEDCETTSDEEEEDESGEGPKSIIVSSSSSSSESDDDGEDESSNGVIEASRESKAANGRLENVLERLGEVEVPSDIIWYEPGAIQHHRVVWAALRDGVDVLNGRIRHVSPHLVWRMFDYTYGIIMRCLPATTQAPMGASDEYEHTPLLTMYRACMVFFEYLHRVGDMGRVRFFDAGTEHPEDSKYIRGNYVNVASGPISQYSMKKLVSASIQLETRWSVLALHEDLQDYIYALELAVSKMVVWTYGKSVHNVRECRSAASSNASVDEYYITAECLFRFALRFAALHEQLDSALLFKDRYMVSPAYPILADRVNFKRIKARLTKEAFDTHDDDYQDSVRPACQNLKMRPSECYLFHKLNKTAKRVEPMKMIEMFGEPHQWRKIVDASNVDANDMLDRCEDTVAVRMALIYLMDNLCKQTLGGAFDWYTFYWPSKSFHHPTEVFIDSRLHDTLDMPRYCHLMNDACVFYERQLVSFGAGPESHIQALWYWLHLFQYKLMGRVSETVRTHDLYETLTGGSYTNGAFYAEDCLLAFPENMFMRSIEDETFTKNGDLVLWDVQIRHDQPRVKRGKKRCRAAALSSEGDWGSII